MYPEVCVWLNTQETPHRGRGALLYPQKWTYNSQDDVVMLSRLQPDLKRGGEWRIRF